MGRKVFLSVLGTTYYKKTKYFFKEAKHINYETHFIQEATLKYYLNDEKINFDKIYIFLTEEAYKKNWLHKAQQNSSYAPYDGLSKILIEDLKLNVEPISIPNGKNESELWQIFEIMYKVFENEHEVYLDITHSFRSLPIFLTVLLNYAKTLKNITVKGITYGNWEARDGENYAPVINLTAVNELQNWTNAAGNFIRFGNAEMLYDLTKTEITPILRETKGKDEKANKLREFANSLVSFTKLIRTIRCQEIYSGKQADQLKKLTSEIQDFALPALKPVLNKISEKLDNLDNNDDIINGFRAVQWALNNNLIQQAYSLLRESVITWILFTVFGNNNYLKDHTKRELVSSAIKIKVQNLKPEKWNKPALDNRDFIQKILDANLPIELFKEFDSLGDYRNDIMHAGCREDAREPEKLISKIEKSFNKIIKILQIK